MRLYRFELKKLMTNKMLWIALVSAAILNVFLSGWSAKSELIDPDSYKKLYTELQSLNNNNDKLAEYLKQRMDAISREDYSTLMLYYQANTQLTKVSNYDTYLEGIDKRAETMTEVSIFADKDSFVYRSILRTPPAYKHLKGIQPKFINSKSIMATTDSLYTDILAFLLIFLIVILLILGEKDRGLFALLRPTRKGRVQLLFAKLLAIYTSCILVFFLLYTGKYSMSVILYGSCDISSVIQSVEGFLGSTLKISIGGYLIVYAVTKVAAYFLIASFLVFLSIIAKSALFVYVTASAYTIISSLLYVLIKGNSYLSVFKYINPICLIDTNVLYENYLDLNFFGQPLNLLKIGILMLILGNVLFVGANLLIFAKQKNLIFRDSRLIQWLLSHIHVKRRVSSSLWRYEAYKILVTNKALFILITVVLLGWNSYKTYQMPFFMNDSIYKFYVSQVEGPIVQETYDYIENEKARYQKIKDELAILTDQLSEGKINHLVYENLTGPLGLELGREIGFYMLQNKVHELEPYSEKSGNLKPWLVYDTGYNQLLGIMMNKDLNFAHLLFLLGLIACAAPIYAAENTFCAKRLLMTTPKGRMKSFYRRFGIGAIATTILFIAAYLPGVVNILESYGTSGIEAPIQSISGYHDFPFPISIAGFICLIYGIRLLAAILMLMFVLCISYFSKNMASALSIASAAFLAPYVLVLLGLDFVSTIMWNPNLIVSDYFMDASAATMQYILIINFILIVTLGFCVIKRTFTHIKNAY